MVALPLIIAVILAAASIWRFNADDWAWWRERVRRAEGCPPMDGVSVAGEVRLFERLPAVAPASLQPVGDAVRTVEVRAATASAMQLVRLVYGEAAELRPEDIDTPPGLVQLLPGPEVEVVASPAALRRLLLRVLRAAAAGQLRSTSSKPVPVCVDPVALLVVSSGVGKRVDRAAVRAADALGWTVSQSARDGNMVVRVEGYGVRGIRETVWS